MHLIRLSAGVQFKIIIRAVCPGIVPDNFLQGGFIKGLDGMGEIQGIFFCWSIADIADDYETTIYQ
jgi:hypothetical protein